LRDKKTPETLMTTQYIQHLRMLHTLKQQSVSTAPGCRRKYTTTLVVKQTVLYWPSQQLFREINRPLSHIEVYYHPDGCLVQLLVVLFFARFLPSPPHFRTVSLVQLVQVRCYFVFLFSELVHDRFWDRFDPILVSRKPLACVDRWLLRPALIDVELV
jgi:hypothetical protein